MERGCLGGSPDSELPADVGNASICADRRGKSYLTLSSRCDGNTGRHKGTGRRVSDQPAQPAATVCLGQPGPPARERTHHTPWRGMLRRPPVREGGCIPTGSDLGIPRAPVSQASGPSAAQEGACPEWWAVPLASSGHVTSGQGTSPMVPGMWDLVPKLRGPPEGLGETGACPSITAQLRLRALLCPTLCQGHSCLWPAQRTGGWWVTGLTEQARDTGGPAHSRGQ